MKKILIAMMAVGMFAAFSGIATAGEEAAPPKAEKTEKAGKAKGKKGDKAAGDTAAPAGEKAPDAAKK